VTLYDVPPLERSWVNPGIGTDVGTALSSRLRTTRLDGSPHQRRAGLLSCDRTEDDDEIRLRQRDGVLAALRGLTVLRSGSRELHQIIGARDSSRFPFLRSWPTALHQGRTEAPARRPP
jgi:hypothetical protein